jgi:hypothetical protein
MCPKGTDILHERTDASDTELYQVQTIVLAMPGYDTTGDSVVYDAIGDLEGTSFALTFKTTLNETFTTYPLVFGSTTTSTDMADAIETALESLPNGVIDDVEVTGTDSIETKVITWDMTDTTNWFELQFAVTFQGATVQGPQNLLSVVDYTCNDGCTPKLVGIPLRDTTELSYVKETTLSDFNNYECGRRGKCDYESGLCTCFDGYTGESCAIQTALI